MEPHRQGQARRGPHPPPTGSHLVLAPRQERARRRRTPPTGAGVPVPQEEGWGEEVPGPRGDTSRTPRRRRRRGLRGCGVRAAHVHGERDAGTADGRPAEGLDGSEGGRVRDHQGPVHEDEALQDAKGEMMGGARARPTGMLDGSTGAALDVYPGTIFRDWVAILHWQRTSPRFRHQNTPLWENSCPMPNPETWANFGPERIFMAQLILPLGRLTLVFDCERHFVHLAAPILEMGFVILVGDFFLTFVCFARNVSIDVVKDSIERADLSLVMRGLNVLGKVPWKINPTVLDVALKCWDEGIVLGDIPSQTDLEVPPLPQALEYRDYTILGDLDKKTALDSFRKYKDALNRHNRFKQKNMDLHSLRCSAILKLNQAKKFRDFGEVYFPYNVDFRGRAYPVPPHLSIVGSDLCRALLVFAHPKPLGKNGLYWLKVHLANLAG
mmetsp:Transcript_5668/g.8609  ORF Transcript_5668/g.8609 Transcript_5668/m.8609 type:complete len:440 (+) Transcript_5668:2389-3708(+)